MKKVVVLSDTHGSESLIQVALAHVHRIQPDLVIHLGDYYDDADVFINEGIPLLRVPGTWRDQYQNSYIDNRLFEDIEGWRFFLTHTPTVDSHDLPEDRDPQQVIDKRLGNFGLGFAHSISSMRGNTCAHCAES